MDIPIKDWNTITSIITTNIIYIPTNIQWPPVSNIVIDTDTKP